MGGGCVKLWSGSQLAPEFASERPSVRHRAQNRGSNVGLDVERGGSGEFSHSLGGFRKLAFARKADLPGDRYDVIECPTIPKLERRAHLCGPVVFSGHGHKDERRGR